MSANGLVESENLKMPRLFDSKDEFLSVACGKDHMVMVTLDGRLMTMGSNDHGKLGLAPIEKEEFKTGWIKRHSGERLNTQIASTKGQIGVVDGGDLKDVKVKQAACGFQHTVALSEDGNVYSWGRGKNGALGHKDDCDVSQPKRIEGLSNIVKIDCGSHYTIVLDKDGNLFSFGSNNYGQLGLAGMYTVTEPTKIPVSRS